MKLPQTPAANLTGKMALVTGGNSGLGLASAVALAEAGAKVFILARNQAKSAEAVAAIQAAGWQAAARAVDVTDTAAMRRVIKELPTCSILVNNAGMNRPAEFIEVSEEDYDYVFNVNVRAAFFVAQEFARRLLAAGEGGSIINMSSQMGLIGGVRRSVYCATKHAMEGFSKSMAWELGPHNIRVNTICPTFFATPLTENMLQDAEFVKEVKGKIALSKIGYPEDLMAAIVFLAGDGAAMVTGSALKLDGGWTAI